MDKYEILEKITEEEQSKVVKEQSITLKVKYYMDITAEDIKKVMKEVERSGVKIDNIIFEVEDKRIFRM